MYKRSLLFTLCLFSLLGFGLGHLDARSQRQARHHASWRRQMERNSDRKNGTLERRFDEARLTYYDAGENACGSYDSGSDFVVALNSAQWDNGAHCYKPITIWYGGKSTQAKITDLCPGCPYGGLDLSRGLFGFLGDLGLGVLTASWDFENAAPPPPAVNLQQAAYTPYTAYSAPTTTQWTPTSTYESTPTYASPTPFSGYSSFSTLTVAFSSYSSFPNMSASTGTTVSVATPAATPSATTTRTKMVASDKGTLNKLNIAVVGLGALIDFAYRLSPHAS
ncbi:RlpA-like double-psi beta-barrel-protein domain-containing protein-containing protein [Fomitopsis betulina]|nr:RlpA-like double-psi beta-barrel-protein domain-containing protein-containing protein [Fomitopsis betulina]